MTDTFSLPTYDDVAAAAGRIAGTAIATPVLSHSKLNDAAGATVLVKAECLQLTGSFKIRGAMNRLAQINESGKEAGVVAFSSGNHAQGVARAARLLGMPALIVMPEDAPQVKVDGVLADGADIHFYHRETESREEIAEAIAYERGAVLVPSFNDEMIIAGQGTCGLEFARQAEAQGGPLDHLICCVGGGGLVTGISLAMAELSPATKIWAAEPQGHDDWKRSLTLGRIETNEPGTRSICDALLTPSPGEITFAVGKDRLRGGFTVSDDEARAAVRFAATQMKLVAEPGGAVALACALRGLPDEMRGQRVGVVVTGGNIDPAMFVDILAG